MNHREKGRYLKSKGWIPVIVYGNRRNWRDPLHPMKGTLGTHEAHAVQKARDQARTT